MDENGRFSGLTTRQQGFLTQLLIDANVERAARAAGIGATTAWRYLKEDAFRRVYQQARAEQMEIAVAALQARCLAAVETLERNLTCGEPATEIRSAGTILRQALGLKTEISGPGGGQIPITEIVVELREPAAGMSLRPPQREPWTSSPPLPEPVSVENTESLNPDGGLTVVLDMPSWQISSDE